MSVRKRVRSCVRRGSTVSTLLEATGVMVSGGKGRGGGGGRERGGWEGVGECRSALVSLQKVEGCS